MNKLNKKRKYVKYLMSLLVLCLVMGGGIVFWQRKNDTDVLLQNNDTDVLLQNIDVLRTQNKNYDNPESQKALKQIAGMLEKLLNISPAKNKNNKNEFDTLIDQYTKKHPHDIMVPIFLHALQICHALPQATCLYRNAISKNIIFAQHQAGHLETKSAKLHSLGNIFVLLENDSLAFDYYKKVLVLTEEKAKKITAQTHQNMGTIYCEQSKYKKAIAAYEKARDIYAATVGEEDVDYADILSNLGMVYYAQQQYPEAIAQYEKALDIYEATVGEEDVNYAHILSNLGMVYYAQQQYPEAIAAYEKALDIYEATVEEEDVDYAHILSYLGMVYYVQQQYPDAIAAYEKALGIYAATVGKNSDEYTHTLSNLDNAKKKLESYKIFSFYEKLFGIFHPCREEIKALKSESNTRISTG